MGVASAPEEHFEKLAPMHYTLINSLITTLFLEVSIPRGILLFLNRSIARPFVVNANIRIKFLATTYGGLQFLTPSS